MMTPITNRLSSASVAPASTRRIMPNEANASSTAAEVDATETPRAKNS